jgi:succinyl-diaminopimelate desuccinylase
VPAGEGWTVTEPFKPIVKDGRIYGRGTSDDKGPLLCALYAMRALKETGVELKKGVRLIMGADEETGSGTDIAKYYATEPEAEMTFSPDAEFPLINIEKGQFRGTISKTVE